jgi:hypothetical protein
MYVTCKIFLQGIYIKKIALPLRVKMPEFINNKLPIHITLENTQRICLGVRRGLITMGRMKKTDGVVMLEKGRNEIKILKA